MEWSIQRIARLAGVSSRTLRHYDDVGILPPSRIDAGGMRHYDASSLARLQRILLLRRLGVGIPAIRASLDAASDEEALAVHLTQLRAEADRLDKQITAVERMLEARKKGAVMTAEQALDGFDHGQYEQEVTERWGADAWQRGQRWWQGMTDADKQAFQQEHLDIAAGYAAARDAGLPADSGEVQALAARHVAWIGASWQREPQRDAVLGLADMYVADPRFARNYAAAGEESVEGAEYVREALRVWAARASR